MFVLEHIYRYIGKINKEGMAFIVSKKSNRHGQERLLYYFVENYRQGSKIKRRTIFKMKWNNNLDDFLAMIQRQESFYLATLAPLKKRYNDVSEKSRQYPNSVYLNSIMQRLILSIQRLKIRLDDSRQLQEKVKSYM